jgi:lysophospholipase L1-like esterase
MFILPLYLILVISPLQVFQTSFAARALKNVSSRQAAATIFILIFFHQVAYPAAIRIMPLGDSITVGFSSGVIPDNSQYYVSYRKALRDRLVAAGYEINYVGNELAGNAVFTDAQHEGHSGWHADGVALQSIRPAVNAFLTANPADIVLLHIGTNDISNGQSPTGVSNEINNILNEINNYEQASGRDVWVVLALIINHATGCTFRTQTTQLNDLVDQMAAARQNSGDRIVIVDMETANGAGLDYDLQRNGGDMFDCVHPYNTGFAKMADEWFQGLLAILPTARAGADQSVNPGASVSLNGNGSSDSLGTITTYAWTQSAGSPAVSITNAGAAVTSFTAPSVSGGTALTFTLTITDDKAFSHSDACIVTVNGPPVAVAGADQVVNANATVTLDGTASTDPGAGGAIAAYQWVQTAGSPVVLLTGANTAKASFTAPGVGSGGMDLVFKLTVTDSNGAQDEDTCIVHVNVLPVADAGEDQSVRPGVVVSLDGSMSTDPLNDVLSFQWVQTSGPIVVLSDATSIRPSFTAPSAVESEVVITFSLTVKDQGGLQSTDSCTVTVSPNQGSSGSGGGGGCFIITAGSGGRKEHTTDLK